MAIRLEGIKEAIIRVETTIVSSCEIDYYHTTYPPKRFRGLSVKVVAFQRGTYSQVAV